MEKTLKFSQNNVIDDENENDFSEENDGFVMVSAENNANLVNCSNVIVGNELKGPISVENMILLAQKDSRDEKTSNAEYNVGSIVEMFTTEGLKLLEESFKENPRPDKAERDRLAQATGTRRKMVRKWFEIERSKRKNELSFMDPVTMVKVRWCYWSRKFRRKVKLMSLLIVFYIIATVYCLNFATWNQFILTTTIGFLILHTCTYIL